MCPDMQDWLFWMAVITVVFFNLKGLGFWSENLVRGEQDWDVEKGVVATVGSDDEDRLVQEETHSVSDKTGLMKRGNAAMD